MEYRDSVSIEQAKQYIDSIDFAPIISKLVSHMGWHGNHAEEACRMYRHFLFLQKKYGQQCNLPPSEDVDDFWHMHILDSKLYRKNCQELFGYYLDHYPYLGIDGSTDFAALEKAFAKTVELYRAEFSEELLEVRGMWAKVFSDLKTRFAKKPARVARKTRT